MQAMLKVLQKKRVHEFDLPINKIVAQQEYDIIISEERINHKKIKNFSVHRFYCVLCKKDQEDKKKIYQKPSHILAHYIFNHADFSIQYTIQQSKLVIFAVKIYSFRGFQQKEQKFVILLREDLGIRNAAMRKQLAQKEVEILRLTKLTQEARTLLFYPYTSKLENCNFKAFKCDQKIYYKILNNLDPVKMPYDPDDEKSKNTILKIQEENNILNLEDSNIQDNQLWILWNNFISDNVPTTSGLKSLFLQFLDKNIKQIVKNNLDCSFRNQLFYFMFINYLQPDDLLFLTLKYEEKLMTLKTD